MLQLHRGGLAASLAAALLTLSACAPSSAPSPAPSTATPASAALAPATGPAPAAGPGAAALRGLGRLAFVQSGHLFLLVDGAIKAVAHQGQATAPAWSGDGRWVAFRTTAADGQEQIAIAGLDGSVQTVNLPGGGGFAWSPGGATLALSPTGGAKGLWLTEPVGTPRPLAAAGQTVSMAWAPDGKSLAYVAVLPFDPQHPEERSDSLFTVPVSGGEPTQHYVAPQAGIWLAGWWPDGKGVLFWQDPMHSSSIAADGLPLLKLALPGSDARILVPTMLGIPSWLAWAPDGKRLAVVTGGGREAWRERSVSICTLATESCQPIAPAAGTLSLDPAWSPTGEQIAFVRAPQPAPGSPTDAAKWAADRSLWLVGADGKGGRAVAEAGKGVSAPTWLKDGRHLLYIREGALWLLDTRQGAPAKVVDLLLPNQGGAFSGLVSWERILAYYPGN